MGMFKQVVTAQLKVLLCVLLVGNAFRALPAKHGANAKACGEDLYFRVVLTQVLLPLTALAAAMLLFNVRVLVRVAEDSFDGGIGSVAVGWKRRSLRGVLLLAVALSFAASVLAVVASEDGFLYRTGCDAGYGAGSPVGVLMIGIFALVHAFFAWVAVYEN